MIHHRTTWEKSLSRGKIGEELFLKWRSAHSYHMRCLALQPRICACGEVVIPNPAL